MKTEHRPRRGRPNALVPSESPRDPRGGELQQGAEPLPPLDRLTPAHVTYVRGVLERFRVTPRHVREDLAQEALLEAHRSRGSRLDVRALLFGITRHVVLHWLGTRHAERAIAALIPAGDPFTARSAEDEVEDGERFDALRSAIDDLPDLLRDVFVRTQVEQMTMAEAVRDLGIPVNTGYSRLHLARIRFLASFRRRLARHRR